MPQKEDGGRSSSFFEAVLKIQGVLTVSATSTKLRYWEEIANRRNSRMKTKIFWAVSPFIKVRRKRRRTLAKRNADSPWKRTKSMSVF